MVRVVRLVRLVRLVCLVRLVGLVRVVRVRRRRLLQLHGRVLLHVEAERERRARSRTRAVRTSDTRASVDWGASDLRLDYFTVAIPS